MMYLLRASILLSFCLASGVVVAQDSKLYRWVDNEGVVRHAGTGQVLMEHHVRGVELDDGRASGVRVAVKRGPDVSRTATCKLPNRIRSPISWP